MKRLALIVLLGCGGSDFEGVVIEPEAPVVVEPIAVERPPGWIALGSFNGSAYDLKIVATDLVPLVQFSLATNGKYAVEEVANCFTDCSDPSFIICGWGSSRSIWAVKVAAVACEGAL